MKYLKFTLGFIYNVSEMLFHIIPMSICVGKACYREDVFPWQIDEVELGHIIEEIAAEDDE